MLKMITLHELQNKLDSWFTSHTTSLQNKSYLGLTPLCLHFFLIEIYIEYQKKYMKILLRLKNNMKHIVSLVKHNQKHIYCVSQIEYTSNKKCA